MKKVLITTDCFLPRWDGISSFLNEIIPKIQDKYNITVIAPNFGSFNFNYNARIIRFDVFKVRLGDIYPSKVNIKLMAREIKKTDIVFMQSFGFIGLFSLIIAKMLKKKVIRYHHTNEWELFPKSINAFKLPINIMVKLLGKILYNLPDITLVSSASQIELLRSAGAKKEKKVVHLGVDIKKYRPVNKTIAKHRLGIDPKKFVVGYAGRLGHEKGLKTLYRAFLRLQKKYDNVLLLIAGGGNPEIEKIFSNKPNVILTGSKNNLARYYQAMDVYVLPSLTETTSLTTMEAMATSTPVIVTPVGFIVEYINDGVNGLLFPKSNSYALFAKIEFLKNNCSARLKLGQNARTTIVENYTWEKTAGKIIKIIDSA